MKEKEKMITMNEVWTQTGTMDILFYLLENKQGILSDLGWELRKNPLTVQRAVHSLLRAKFIKEEEGDRHSRLFTITKTGVQIAELAKQQKELFEQINK